MKFLFSILFLGSLVFCQAQDNFDKKLDSLRNMKDYPLQLELLKKWESEVKNLNSFQKGEFYHELGVSYYRNKSFVSSIENIERALDLKAPIRETNPYSFQSSLNILHLSYMKNGNTEEQLKTLYRVLGEKQFTKFVHYAHRRLALYFMDLGDYFQSIEYSNRIINDYAAQKGESYYISYYVRSLISVLTSYAEMRTYEPEMLERIRFYEKKVNEVLEELSLDQKYEFYNNLGVIYRGLGEKELALKSYQLSLKTIEEIEDRTAIHSLYSNIGEMYSQLKDSVKAYEYYNKVLSTSDSINISAVYNNIGYYHAKSLDEEIELHQKALQILENDGGFSGDSFFPEDIKNSSYKEEFFSIFIDLSKAWIKKYHSDGDTSHLERALKILRRIDNFVSVIRLDSQTKGSKLFWIKRGVNSYVEAVKVCFLLNKPEEAFYFMEKNKSLYLLEQLGRIQLNSEYKIPNDLLEKENNLKYKVLLAKSNLNQQPNDLGLLETYKKASQQQFRFSDSLHNAFPEFFRSSLNTDIISLADFQEFLKKSNSQAMEYIMGEDAGYGLWLDGDQLQFFKLQNYSELVESIALLKKFYTKPSMTQEEVASFNKHSAFVFRTLFPFENAKQYIEAKELRIVPSGILYNFQFEALLVDDQESLKDNYLIHIGEVSYLNSATVAQKLYANNVSESLAYFGMAPVSFSEEELPDLDGSELSTNKIAALFSSEVGFKEQATKSAFLNASSSLMFHVNTHAGIDQQTQLPWIAMYDSVVSLEELYVKSRPHNLVFLDACKTADGKLQRGEGIESLSKAFFHTGTKSVVASQWNANEKTTNEIALLFFEELKKGNTKSAALRKAKLTYLEKSQLSEALPYFWASFTLTGNSDTLPERPNKLHYWIVIGFIIVVFFLIVKMRKHSKS